MSDRRGPITLITSISDQRNRWKDIAYGWKAVALQAVERTYGGKRTIVWKEKLDVRNSRNRRASSLPASYSIPA